MKEYEWPYVFVDTDWSKGDAPIFTIYRVKEDGNIVGTYRDLTANQAMCQIQNSIHLGFHVYPNNNRNIAAVISRIQILPTTN